MNVLHTKNTVKLGIDGHTGIITGISESESFTEYAVLIDGEAYMVNESDINATGRIKDKDEIHDGHTLQIPPQKYCGDS